MNATRPRVLLAANPHSRRGPQAAAAARSTLLAAGCTVLPEERHAQQDIAALIREHIGAADAVAIAGGDGTLNAAAPALLEAKLPLLIIPAGTANDLARTLGIPPDPAAATRLLLEGCTRRIDIGFANDVPFFNVASIGFGVDLARALTRDSKRRWGVLGYLLAAARTLRRLRPFTAYITHGKTTTISRTVHVAVGNGRHYGGGMTVAEHACIDDNRLDVFSLEISGLWGLLKLLPALRSGRHGHWTEIRTLAGEELDIHTHRPRSVNTDGEITTHTPAVFRVLPGAVTVFAPPSSPNRMNH